MQSHSHALQAASRKAAATQKAKEKEAEQKKKIRVAAPQRTGEEQPECNNQ